MACRKEADILSVQKGCALKRKSVPIQAILNDHFSSSLPPAGHRHCFSISFVPYSTLELELTYRGRTTIEGYLHRLHHQQTIAFLFKCSRFFGPPCCHWTTSRTNSFSVSPTTQTAYRTLYSGRISGASNTLRVGRGAGEEKLQHTTQPPLDSAALSSSVMNPTTRNF